MVHWNRRILLVFLIFSLGITGCSQEARIQRLLRKGKIEKVVEIGKPAVPVLVEALKNENRDVRWNAVESLRRIHDKSAVPALIETLKDEDATIRLKVVETFEVFKDTSTVPALIETLKDKDKNVRLKVIECLGMLGDKSIASSLIPMLEDPDAMVCVKTGIVLAKLGDSTGLSTLLEAFSGKFKAAKEETKKMQLDAVRATAEIQDKKSKVEVLTKVLESGKIESKEIVLEVIKILRDLIEDKYKPAVVSLVKLLDHKDETIRARAFDILTQDKSTILVLLKTLLDRDSCPRLLWVPPAVWTGTRIEKKKVWNFSARIWKIGEPVIPLLADLALEHKDSSMKTWAIWILGGTKEKSAVPPLVKMLLREDFPGCGYTEIMAAHSLGHIKDKSAVPALTQAWKHLYFLPAREAAISALAEIGDKSAIRSLNEALEHREPEIREAAISALEEIDKSAILKEWRLGITAVINKSEKAWVEKGEISVGTYVSWEPFKAGPYLIFPESWEGRVKGYGYDGKPWRRHNVKGWIRDHVRPRGYYEHFGTEIPVVVVTEIDGMSVKK